MTDSSFKSDEKVSAIELSVDCSDDSLMIDVELVGSCKILVDELFAVVDFSFEYLKPSNGKHNNIDKNETPNTFLFFITKR